MTSDGGLPHDGYGFVGWKVMAVILQNRQTQCRDQSVGCIARDQIHLFLLQSACEKSEVHDAWGLGEIQVVGGGESFVAVRTLHEFVTEAGTPLRRVRSGLGDRLQMQPARIVTAKHDGERIVETERGTESQAKAPFVF